VGCFAELVQQTSTGSAALAGRHWFGDASSGLSKLDEVCDPPDPDALAETPTISSATFAPIRGTR
jgi:hypothetical protein